MMGKFLAGNRVRITGNKNYHGFEIGEEVVINCSYQNEENAWVCYNRIDWWIVKECDMELSNDNATNLNWLLKHITTLDIKESTRKEITEAINKRLKELE